jgi:hypothetical protein
MVEILQTIEEAYDSGKRDGRSQAALLSGEAEKFSG